MVANGLPKVFYLGDLYVSHQVAASAYCRELARLGCLVDRLEDAQIVVVHQEIERLKWTLQRVPHLSRTYVVAIAVWETDTILEQDAATLSLVQEIWTPTLFSARALCKAHRRVLLLPHVVDPPQQPTNASIKAKELVAGWLASARPTFDVLAVCREHEPRKNVQQLRLACLAVARSIPTLRFIHRRPEPDVKLDRPKLHSGRHQLTIAGPLSQPTLLAMLQQVQVVASAHRAEGWGLVLSEAMSVGTLTVATNFSGNLAFMRAENSLLVDCTVGKVGRHKGTSPFLPESTWAYPAQVSLEDKILAAHAAIRRGTNRTLRASAKMDVARYSDCAIGRLLRAHLRRIANTLDVAASRADSPH